LGDYITRYDRMPIPPLADRTTYFEAGALCFGVEFRILTDETVAEIRKTLQAANGAEEGQLENLDDAGVSLHVFAAPGRPDQECIRFDCFAEDPHYHYINWAASSNEMIHIDPHADGDPLTWALERIRTRLPQMLRRCGEADLASKVDLSLIEEVLPRIADAAYHARYRAQENS
jgi:hypothetical protein